MQGTNFAAGKEAPQAKPYRLPALTIGPRPANPLRQPLPPSADMKRLGITLRAETPDDMSFLHGVYAETRAAEMLMLRNAWTPEAKRDFVDTQFGYQYFHHAKHYADGDFAIIELHGRPIGRFYVHWGTTRGRDCRLFEFQLLTPFRSRGIGSTLIAALLGHARTQRYKVTLHVDRMSPARRLYARFGFRDTGQGDGMGSLLMEWQDGPVVPGLRLAE
jgi:GNAT superfamily N-acetyltransferase